MMHYHPFPTEIFKTSGFPHYLYNSISSTQLESNPSDLFESQGHSPDSSQFDFEKIQIWHVKSMEGVTAVTPLQGESY